MAAAGARIPTAHAARYLERLCRRFARRAPTLVDGAAVQIDHPLGLCRLIAGPDGLALRAEAKDPARLEDLKWMLAGQLARVAPRERFQLEWVSCGVIGTGA